MPDSITSLPEVRCFALEEFARKRAAPDASKSQFHDRRTSPIRIEGDRLKARKGEADVLRFPISDANGRTTKTRSRGARTNPTQTTTANTEPPPQQPSRKLGSSIYYGVRFRPDLNKWVAEIRVAEWKAVDKKVWLGTFDTEEGAARGVDLARKLLKCQKKHDFNLPCPKLDAYSGQIPPNLNLTDVTTTTMFKAATLFIKRECQEYAASFHDSPDFPNSPTSLITQDHHHSPHITHFQQPPANANMTVSQTNSFDSEIVDDLGNENSDSDHESCMVMSGDEFYHTNEYSISVNDYLTDDYQSSHPSSYTSATSSMTLEHHVLHDQQCVDVADHLSSGPSSLVAEFGDARCIVSTRLMQGGVQGGMQGGMQDEIMQGAVSQECWAEVQRTWPGLVSSSALAPLPGTYYEMTPYISYMDGAPMDCDDLSFQNFHNYPFQYGSNRWY